MSWWLLLFPVLAAVIGWLLNSLAVAYFFRKLLPAAQKQIASNVARSVPDSFSFSDIEEKIANGDGMKKLMPLIEGHIDHFLRHKLNKSLPIISMFIGEKTINQLKEVFMAELEEIFPSTMQSYFAQLQQDLDIQQMVSQKILSIPSSDFSNKIKQAIPDQLRQFKLLGAGSGFIIGLVLVGLVWVMLLFKL